MYMDIEVTFLQTSCAIISFYLMYTFIVLSSVQGWYNLVKSSTKISGKLLWIKVSKTCMVKQREIKDFWK